MALRENFPAKDILEKEGYTSVEDVSEATDEELHEIDGIGDVTLEKIREEAPYKPSDEETGPGATSGKTEAAKAADGSLDPTAQSHMNQTSKSAKDQTDPVTNQELPDGIIKNERGTLTASSTVDQPDMIHPDTVAAQRQAALRQAGERISAALEG